MPGKKKKRSSEVFYLQNKVELLRGGKPYFDRLLQMIASAKESFHLQTYIYDDDDTGKLVANALKEAVKRNVQVYLLADGYASNVMSNTFINDLKNSGIHFRFFNPLFKSSYFYFGRRLHHKVAVADATYALVGGVNITNRYNDMPDKPAWLDFALYMEGEAVQQLCILCWKTWKNYPKKMGLTPCEKNKPEYHIPTAESYNISMRRNDWVRRKNEISYTYVSMLRNATSHITFLCSYFLPGRVIRRQITNAVKRGIRIRVVAAGISDVMLAKYAERYMYNWLLKNNIELYEYQPNVLHGKIAVCDSQWLTIGSYNLNDISAYASIELNMNVYNRGFAKKTEDLLQDIIDKDCIAVTKEYYIHSKNIIKQFTRWLSYEFIRVIFYLFTFYFKRKS
jgi:cardiolipin synthase A/B